MQGCHLHAHDEQCAHVALVRYGFLALPQGYATAGRSVPRVSSYPA